MSQERRREKRRLEEAAKQPYISRRGFLALGAAGAFAAAEEYFFGGIRKAAKSIFGENYVSFEDAKNRPEKRAQYVNDIVRRFELDKLPYVESIEYAEIASYTAPKEIHGPNAKFAMTTQSRSREIGNGGKFKILVYSPAFEAPNYLNENDFINGLGDHEVIHAKMQSEGFHDIEFNTDDFSHKDHKEKFASILVDSITELYAYRNEINEAPKRNVSREHFLSSLRAYWFYYSNLICPSEEDNLLKNPEAIKRFREFFFAPFFLRMEITHKEIGYQGPVIMPDDRMMTYNGPLELPIYLKGKVAQWRNKKK